MIFHTLTNGTLSVLLPADMMWVDEFQFTPLKTKATVTLDGGQVLEQSLQIKGRPITLEAAEDHGWITRAVLLDLYALASGVALLTLTLADGRVFSVAFAADPVTARPLWPSSIPAADDVYVAVVKLIER